MATAAAALELIALPRGLTARARADVRASLSALLRARTRSTVRAPNATPIVAVYDRGSLVGCALSRDAVPGNERLVRAFHSATATARGELAVEAFFPRRVRWLAYARDLEIGTEGVALVRRGHPPVLLMPRVARDHVVDTEGLLALLADKAGLARLPRGARLAAWTTESVVARSAGRRDFERESAHAAAATKASAADYAAAWLARMIDARGAVAFAIDARARVLQPDGELWHARSAIAIEALAAHGGHARTVARARRWLGDEVARALRGQRVPGWPGDSTGESPDSAVGTSGRRDPRAAVAGTVALACLAGVPAHARLLELVADGRWRTYASPAWPWHAAQVAAALGRDTPHDLWSYCVDSLADQPFAPYVALAARAIDDSSARRRATAAVASCIRKRAPHAGGANATALPETALTAVAAQALAGSAHRAAHAAALAFIRARQLLPGNIPAPLDPRLALGAFSSTPVDDVLRADIVGHALLALTR